MPGSILSELCRASPCSLVKVFQQSSRGYPGGVDDWICQGMSVLLQYACQYICVNLF